jgi:hypothetical protein
VMKTRIMYIEQKTGDFAQAFIGRVTFSKSGRTIYYRDKAFVSVGDGNYGNYYGYDKKEYIVNQNVKEQKRLAYEVYWISGPKKDGSDRGDGRTPVIQIDEDVREEYWATIRGLPESIAKESF